MIELEIIDHSISSILSKRYLVNPSTILWIRDGRENICGMHYVEVKFSPEAEKTLPTDSDGVVAVRGSYVDVLQKIMEGGIK